MRKLVDEALTEAEDQSEETESLLDLSDLSDLGLRKITAMEGRISGYVTAISTGQYINIVSLDKTEPRSEEVDEAVAEILEISTEIMEEKSNPVVVENLLDSLNLELDKLWELRRIREREFAKLIILIKAIIGGTRDESFNEKQIESIVAMLRFFKLPKIGEIDIKKCTKIGEDSGLNIYKPLIKNPKIKITIQQEE